MKTPRADNDDMNEAIAAFLQYLTIERNASPLTVKSYACDFGSLMDFLGEAQRETPITPAEMDVQLLRGYSAYLSSCDYQSGTICRKLASLRSFFRWAHRQGIIDKNPAKALRSPKRGRRLPTVLSEDEAVALIEATTGEFAVRNKAILETLYSAGLRVAELCGMNTQDWDRDSNELRVRGKGKKERIAMLGKCATAALHDWLAIRKPSPKIKPADADAMWLNRFGTRLSDWSVRQCVVKKSAHAAGVDLRTSPHTMRHSFATHMIDNGAGLREVQELLGHASIGTTQVYTHVSTARLKETYHSSHPHAVSQVSGVI